MNPMEELYERMFEEISDAKHYIEKACACKTEYPETAKLFAQISGEEMKHATMIEAEIKRLIASEKTKHPEEMTPALRGAYNIMHGLFSGMVVEVKGYNDRFKEV